MGKSQKKRLLEAHIRTMKKYNIIVNGHFILTQPR